MNHTRSGTRSMNLILSLILCVRPLVLVCFCLWKLLVFKTIRNTSTSYSRSFTLVPVNRKSQSLPEKLLHCQSDLNFLDVLDCPTPHHRLSLGRIVSPANTLPSIRNLLKYKNSLTFSWLHNTHIIHLRL